MHLRLLKTFCYMNDNCNIEILSDLYSNLESLQRYFCLFNRHQTDEAISRALMHAIDEFDPRKGSMTPYLKKLARTVMLNSANDVPQEDIEDYAIDEYTEVEESAIESVVFVDLNKAIEKKIVISYMKEFVKLCNLILETSGDINSIKKYFSEEFKTVCISLIQKTEAKKFITSLLYVYRSVGEEIKWFLEQADLVDANEYVEVSYSEIDSRKAKRIAIVDKDGNPIKRPDVYHGQLYIKGATSGRSVWRVKFSDLYYQMELKASSPITNELVGIVGNDKVIRTCGGSISSVNPDMDNMLDVFLDELILNILKASGCRLLCTGYEYVYMIQGKYSSMKNITLRGLIGFGSVELPLETVDVLPI